MRSMGKRDTPHDVALKPMATTATSSGNATVPRRSAREPAEPFWRKQDRGGQEPNSRSAGRAPRGCHDSLDDDTDIPRVRAERH